MNCQYRHFISRCKYAFSGGLLSLHPPTFGGLCPPTLPAHQCGTQKTSCSTKKAGLERLRDLVLRSQQNMGTSRVKTFTDRPTDVAQRGHHPLLWEECDNVRHCTCFWCPPVPGAEAKSSLTLAFLVLQDVFWVPPWKFSATFTFIWWSKKPKFGHIRHSPLVNTSHPKCSSVTIYIQNLTKLQDLMSHTLSHTFHSKSQP